jgi:hypothetical protein
MIRWKESMLFPYSSLMLGVEGGLGGLVGFPGRFSEFGVGGRLFRDDRCCRFFFICEIGVAAFADGSQPLVSLL